MKPATNPADNQKEAFRRIRNFLAGRMVGATRDKALMHEVIKGLFCRAKLNGDANVFLKRNQDPLEVAKVYRKTFSHLRRQLPNLFEPDEEILMDPASIAYVDEQLSGLNLYEPSRDPLGDLYESFVGTGIQQDQGQFFTPQNAVSWLVDAVSPQPGERVIDPACGAGGFLSYTARKLRFGGASRKEIADSLFGIEKDAYLAKLADAHISVTTLCKSNVICGDSISWIGNNGKTVPYRDNSFDVVLTNPPFGTRIVSADDRVRQSYELAHKWKLTSDKSRWLKTSRLLLSSPPQVLFIERCIRLLRPGGRMGIVVPESLVSSSTYAYVVQYLKEHTQIEAIIGMPESLFKTSGKGGTHTKTCLIVSTKRAENGGSKAPQKVFMAEAQWCGHDSRGKEIAKDDLPDILSGFLSPQDRSKSRLGFWTDSSRISGNILSPRYHDPTLNADVDGFLNSHDLVSVGDLVKSEVLSFATGDEVGKVAYGGGDVPFIRTSDISNWEIKRDPKHGLSVEVYEKFRKKQDVKAGDILMVRDGTYLIGSCAFVSRYDERIVYQSHLYKIRVNRPEIISPYLLLALLTSDPVQKQIRAKRVTQDIIDSLGDRVYELLLPIPKSKALQKRIGEMVRSSIHERIEARELARRAISMVVGKPEISNPSRAISKSLVGLPRIARRGRGRSATG